MDDYLGMRSVSAPKQERTDETSGPVVDNTVLFPDEAMNAGSVPASGDLGSSIMQSLLYWERIFAYQERVKPRRTNGDAECVEEAGSGTEDEAISG